MLFGNRRPGAHELRTRRSELDQSAQNSLTLYCWRRISCRHRRERYSTRRWCLRLWAARLYTAS